MGIGGPLAQKGGAKDQTEKAVMREQGLESPMGELLASRPCRAGCSPPTYIDTSKMKLPAALSALAVLAACTSISEVAPAGDANYTVTTQVRGGMTPWGEIKASSLKRADEYCKQQGKRMHQVTMQTHGVRGWTPQEAELTFACVAD